MSNDEIEISVIVPTYERPSQLGKLLKRLCKSSFKKFQVIVVDQSTKPFNIDKFKNKINIQYHHVSFRGAALARNFGARLAEGRIIAFTDDDCIPARAWLENAYVIFKNMNIVGLEGRIYPERFKTNPAKYRIVTNLNRENYAFMTANLFVLRECFLLLNGFDERFNEPHFREDTDFGWRLKELGKVVFSNTVQILHPSEKLNSRSQRTNFFIHDALLFNKHPENYMKLFIMEKHYIHTEGFWKYFLEGFSRHRVEYALLIKLLKNDEVNLGYFPLPEIFLLLNMQLSQKE